MWEAVENGLNIKINVFECCFSSYFLFSLKSSISIGVYEIVNKM